MKKLLKFLALLIYSLLLLNCSENDLEVSSVEYLWIGDHKEKCIGVGEQMCYLIKYNDSQSDWEYFYNEIIGFETLFKVGFIYKIKTRKYTVTNPPADGSSFRYELIEIISKTKVIEDSNNN